MKIKGIIDEDFVNYKKPSMFINFPYCTFKCDVLNGCQICQNEPLVREPNIDIDCHEIIERYLRNPITEAIVFGGLEPFDSEIDISELIGTLRDVYHCNDDIVIYTGYTEEELQGNFCYEKICKYFPNIYIKFGRFIMNQESHYDEVLGVTLASPNQYGKLVSSNDNM